MEPSRRIISNEVYGWNNKIRTCFVFLPGLSLIVAKIQFSTRLPFKLVENTKQSVKENNREQLRFANVCKWHLRGSLTQIAATILAVKLLTPPLFVVLGSLAIFEIFYVAAKAIKHGVTIYRFQDSQAQIMNAYTPLSIF